MLGRAKYFEKNKKYNIALEIMSEMGVTHPSFLPGLIEKSKLHINCGDWEQALETIQKVLYDDRNNIQALWIYLFYLLSRESDIDQLMEKLDEL